jgi:hypothetical protein
MRGAPQKQFARIENARRDPVEQHQDEAIQHLEGRALWSSPPQYVQLLAKGDYLCLERASRLEKVKDDSSQ